MNATLSKHDALLIMPTGQWHQLFMILCTETYVCTGHIDPCSLYRILDPFGEPGPEVFDDQKLNIESKLKIFFIKKAADVLSGLYKECLNFRLSRKKSTAPQTMILKFVSFFVGYFCFPGS